MSKQWDKWDTIESLRKSRDGWYDETQIQLARAEAAEARVKVLEEALRKISAVGVGLDPFASDEEALKYWERRVSILRGIARDALAAKEKP